MSDNHAPRSDPLRDALLGDPKLSQDYHHWRHSPAEFDLHACLLNGAELESKKVRVLSHGRVMPAKPSGRSRDSFISVGLKVCNSKGAPHGVTRLNSEPCAK